MIKEFTMRFLLIFTLVTLSTFTHANADLSIFNPQTVQTLKGQVISVQKFSYVNKPVPYIQFIMGVQENEYTVEVGPEWYLNMGGILIVPREEIEVTGSLKNMLGNKKIIRAIQIKKGGVQLKLRTTDGTPCWGEQHDSKK